MLKLKYDLSELEANTSAYITISASDKYGRAVSITTTPKGGLFYWSETEKSYKQTLGTAQYKIDSQNKAKAELKKKYDEYIESLNSFFYCETEKLTSFSEVREIKAKNYVEAQRIALDQRALTSYYLKLGTIGGLNSKKQLLIDYDYYCRPMSKDWTASDSNDFSILSSDIDYD